MNTITYDIVNRVLDKHLPTSNNARPKAINAVFLLGRQQYKTSTALWCALTYVFSKPHSDVLVVHSDFRALHRAKAMLDDVIVPEFISKVGTSIGKWTNIFQNHEEAGRISTYRLPNTSQIHFCVLNNAAAKHFIQHKPDCVIFDDAMRGVPPYEIGEFVYTVSHSTTPAIYFQSAPVYIDWLPVPAVAAPSGSSYHIRCLYSLSRIENPRYFSLVASCTNVYLWNKEEEHLDEFLLDTVELTDSEDIKRSDTPVVSMLQQEKPWADVMSDSLKICLNND